MMNRILRKVSNRVMGSFVGSGVELDDAGRLCLPDGLCPDRVHRFIEICVDERFGSPRDAMSALFRRVGVDEHAVGLLDQIIDPSGDVDFGAAAKHGSALLAALPELKRIPSRFRDLLVKDLGLASASCRDLEEAVISARKAASTRVGCDASWDAILDHGAVLGDIARPWRERIATA